MGNRLTQLIVKTLRPVSNESGKVLGKTAARHTSQEFVEFLTEVVERARRGRSTSFWTIYRRTRVRWFAIFWRRI